MEQLQREPDIVVDPTTDIELWQQMSNAHPYVSFIGTPLFVILSIIVLIIVGRCIYVRKLRATIQRVQAIYSTYKTSATSDIEGGTSTHDENGGTSANSSLASTTVQ